MNSSRNNQTLSRVFMFSIAFCYFWFFHLGNIRCRYNTTVDILSPVVLGDASNVKYNKMFMNLILHHFRKNLFIPTFPIF